MTFAAASFAVINNTALFPLHFPAAARGLFFQSKAATVIVFLSAKKVAFRMKKCFENQCVLVRKSLALRSPCARYRTYISLVDNQSARQKQSPIVRPPEIFNLDVTPHFM